MSYSGKEVREIVKRAMREAVREATQEQYSDTYLKLCDRIEGYTKIRKGVLEYIGEIMTTWEDSEHKTKVLKEKLDQALHFKAWIGALEEAKSVVIDIWQKKSWNDQ